MKTLVIHPEDYSTRYLKQIYAGKDCAAVSCRIPADILKQNIKRHDRIIMLGHGTPHGLLGHGGFMITPELAPLLREKDCIGIWCYANVYFREYGLGGFSTGMIISEWGEAQYYLDKFTEQDIDKSNVLFAQLFRQYMDDRKLETVLAKYTDATNPVISFNRKNLFEYAAKN